jgi:hypothetical protein
MLNQLRYPVWQEPYLAAMVEMDSAKMKAKSHLQKMRFAFA